MIALDAFAPARAHEKVVWVFAIDLPAEEIANFKEEKYSDDDAPISPLVAALGLAHIDTDFIEVFDTETIRDYGFAKYLTDANGMNPAQVNPETAMLAAITGHVLLVFSDALKDQTLAPKAPLRFVGRYSASPSIHPVQKIETEAAKGVLPQPQPPKSDARMSGMVATAALVVMFLIVAMMIWIAG
ncbi:hypothetical protein DS901_10415 [Loktanella sp. D2R18]|uniref:hypothetical protein n=1 Tax=Rhodobacterales TaxID=204455 RepID=UPI000DE8A373|nr:MULTISPECIES: hypothetical protein [Rhodobacterales]MDO6590804.1 hypothetical protein [Yoonia sp. 1_MG-2023]RBW43239.1 hypothetical protein DS901_10415 [Loktanella sp. D2R18]